MKFVIEGREYDPAVLGRLSLWDVKELQKQTGLTVKDMEASAEYLQQFESELDLMSDMEAVDRLGAFLWLARFTAGERDLTFEASMQVPMSEISINTDDDEDEPGEAPDPIEPALPAGAAADPLEDEPVAVGV